MRRGEGRRREAVGKGAEARILFAVDAGRPDGFEARRGRRFANPKPGQVATAGDQGTCVAEEFRKDHEIFSREETLRHLAVVDLPEQRKKTLPGQLKGGDRPGRHLRAGCCCEVAKLLRQEKGLRGKGKAAGRVVERGELKLQVRDCAVRGNSLFQRFCPCFAQSLHTWIKRGVCICKSDRMKGLFSPEIELLIAPMEVKH